MNSELKETELAYNMKGKIANNQYEMGNNHPLISTVSVGTWHHLSLGLPNHAQHASIGQGGIKPFIWP